jgi:gas vesicle protein
MKFLRFLFGLILGAAVGFGVAMYFAPHSGKETQDLIKAKVDRVMAEGQREAERRRAELEAEFNVSKSRPLS